MTLIQFAELNTSAGVSANSATLEALATGVSYRAKFRVDELRAWIAGTSGDIGALLTIGTANSALEKIGLWAVRLFGDTIRLQSGYGNGGGANGLNLLQLNVAALPANGADVILYFHADNALGAGQVTIALYRTDGTAIGSEALNLTPALYTAANTGVVRIARNARGPALPLVYDWQGLYAASFAVAADRIAKPTAGDANLLGAWDYPEGAGDSAAALGGTIGALALTGHTWVGGAAPASIALALAPLTVALKPGQSATLTGTLTRESTTTVVDLTLGAVPAGYTATLSTAQLGAGVTAFELELANVNGGGGGTVTVTGTPVDVGIDPVTRDATLTGPAIGVDTALVSVSAPENYANPASVTRAITNTGGGVLDSLQVAIVGGTGAAPWLSATLDQAAAPAVLTLAFDKTGLVEGALLGATVRITDADASNSPRDMAVELQVLAPVVPASTTLRFRARRLGVAVTPDNPLVVESLDPGVLVPAGAPVLSGGWLEVEVEAVAAGVGQLRVRGTSRRGVQRSAFSPLVQVLPPE